MTLILYLLKGDYMQAHGRQAWSPGVMFSIVLELLQTTNSSTCGLRKIGGSDNCTARSSEECTDAGEAVADISRERMVQDTNYYP